MKRILLSLSAFVVLAMVVVMASGAVGVQRDDCPGKVVCPLTGEQVCKDLCPLIDVARDDCPGQIECPIDGQRVCVDRCPLGKSGASTTEPEGSCCGKK